MDSLWWSVSNNLKASHECCHCLGSASTLFRKKILTSYSLLCTHLLYSFSLPCPLVYFVQGFFLFIVSTILQKRKNTLYFFFLLTINNNITRNTFRIKGSKFTEKFLLGKLHHICSFQRTDRGYLFTLPLKDSNLFPIAFNYK